MMSPRAGRGQTLVEFALIIPLFLALLFAIFDFGRVIWANDAVANAAREAARFAIVHGGSATTACPVGPPVPDVTVVPVSGSCPHPVSPSREAIVDVARAFAVAGGAPMNVEVCYGQGCSGNADVAAPPATNARGTPVTVTVSSTVDLVTGQVLGRGSFNLSSRSTMLVNH
jgi:hypothetical protein